MFLKEGGGGEGWSRRLRGFSRTKVDKIKPGSETSHLHKCETKSFSSLHPCALTLFFLPVSLFTIAICRFFLSGASLTSYLSCRRRRRLIKHPVITKHPLIVNECQCLCAGVSQGNYLMLWSLMTAQTNICPWVRYKMRERPSVAPA